MSEYYIDPAQLSCAIVETQALSCCTEELGQYILTIADKVLQFPSFRSYSRQLKDDMKSYSVERMMKRGIWTVDPTKNPFSYFTSGHSMNYINFLKSHYKRANKERKLVYDCLVKLLSLDLIGDKRQLQQAIKLYDENWKEYEDK